MKTVAILLCSVYLASYAVVHADDNDDVPLSCLKKVGVSVVDVPKLLQDTTEEGIRKRGCIEACIMQKIGLMNSNTIDMQRLDQIIDEIFSKSQNKETMRQSIHECANSAVNDDECVVAQTFARCGLEQLKLSVQQLLNKVTA